MSPGSAGRRPDHDVRGGASLRRTFRDPAGGGDGGRSRCADRARQCRVRSAAQPFRTGDARPDARVGDQGAARAQCAATATASRRSTPRSRSCAGGRVLVDYVEARVADHPGWRTITLHHAATSRRLGHSVDRASAARAAIGAAAMLAHEIKNPLSGIRGAAQLLATGDEANDELTHAHHDRGRPDRRADRPDAGFHRYAAAEPRAGEYLSAAWPCPASRARGLRTPCHDRRTLRSFAAAGADRSRRDASGRAQPAQKCLRGDVGPGRCADHACHRLSPRHGGQPGAGQTEAAAADRDLRDRQRSRRTARHRRTSVRSVHFRQSPKGRGSASRSSTSWCATWAGSCNMLGKEPR